jgi:glycosyltransferase involved in cell wall biosynthesis
MKTILFVETGSGFGGSAVCLDNLIRSLNRQAYEPLVAYMGEGLGIERIQRQGVRTLRLRHGWRWGQLVYWCVRYQVALVHANNELYSHAATLLAAWVLRRPCLVHMRGIRAFTRLERLLIPLVRHFIVISEIGRAHYIEQGMPASRSSTIYDGILKEQFVPSTHAEARHSLGLAAQDLVVGIVSRLVPMKGHRDFLEALRVLAPELPALRGVIVGGDPSPGEPYLNELRQLARHLRLERQVVFTGWRDDVSAMTATFDVAVQASQYLEGFGTAIMEAMALGKPVVATAVGGVPELVENGRTGFLVPSGNPGALAAAILRLARDASLRERFGQAGRRRVEQVFDQRLLTRQIEQVYGACLNGRQATRQGG